MKEKSTIGQVIIVFTEHPVLGSLLIPYITEKDESGTLSLVEQAFHASEEAMANMSEAEREAIRIASCYTEKYLMSVYSREKTFSRFLRKLSEEPEKVKNNIRPFIEKKLMEMLTLIRHNNLPFYQKQGSSKVLYPHHAYHVHQHDVESCFAFEVDSKVFKYQLQCFYKGHPLALSEKKPVIVITSSPATFLLGMEVYFFPHIESTRILPFTKKTSISVDASHLDKYIDNIVIPIARYHKITTHGLEIIEEKRPYEAVLTIEDTICEDPLLRLNFHYGDEFFTPDTATDMQKILYRKESGKIVSFQRDANIESKALQLLLKSGLSQISEAHFRLSPQTSEKTISEWVYNHRTMLQDSFRLASGTHEASFCLDEIRIEQSYDEGPDWFELYVTVVIGNLRIPFSRFRKHILEERKEFLLPDGRMILLPEEWFSKYGNLLEMGTTTEKGIQLKHTFVGAAQSLLEEQKSKIWPINGQMPEIPVPEGLKAQLRPYQQKGFSWMVQLHQQNFGGCLADDMGLGKTLQTLTLLQYIYKPKERIETGVIHPGEKTVEAEVEVDGQYSLFSLATEEVSNSDNQGMKQESHEQTEISQDQAEPNLTSRKPATLIIVPTSLLHNWRRETKRFTGLSATEYHSSSILSSKYPERFFNRYHLIFTTYGMMRNNIDLLRSYRFEYVVLDESQSIKNSDSLTFRTAIQLQSNHRLVITGTPIENSLKDLWAQFHFLQPDLLGDESAFHKSFIAPIRQGNMRIQGRLQQLIAPFVLRRSKKEVAPELPPLIEETIYCDMPSEQHAYYEQEKNSLRNILLQQSRGDEKHQSLSILNGILRLRQISCHPQLIFPDFIDESGKTEQIIETFNTLQSEGHKVLIFSSFVKHLELLADAFHQRGWKYALLTGSTNNRPTEIAHFTEQKDVQAFFISLKAGGVGLNLTEADYVFVIDPWWNPAAEAQAIARAHRIGQEKRVIAYRFITKNSIEEKILLLQQDKKQLAETFINNSETLPALTGEEWDSLL